MGAYNAGDRVRVRRDRSGYRIKGPQGEMLYRRVTSLNALEKPWMGKWAAGQAALAMIREFDEISHLLSVSNAAELAAAAVAIEEKEYGRIPGNIKAAYDMVKKAPWDKRDAAGDFGTIVHNTIEALYKGEPLPADLTTDEEVQCVINAEQLWNDFLEGGEVIHIEVTVVNPEAIVPYAGTFDLYAKNRVGERVLNDWKTSGGIYADFAPQLAAYRHAPYALVNAADYVQESKTIETWTAEVAEWGPHMVDRVMVTHVRPEFAEMREILPENLERWWDTFQAVSMGKMFNLDTDDYNKTPKIEVYSPPLLRVEP